jgi:F0F1-type ATP synthase epsilon subunit
MDDNNTTNPNLAPKEALAPRILKVNVSSPDKVFYDGEAEAVSVVNDKGPFDVLPYHENFISIVYDKVTVHKKIGGEKVEFPIESGVLKIEKNIVTVLTGFDIVDDSMIPRMEKKIIKPMNWFNPLSFLRKDT